MYMCSSGVHVCSSVYCSRGVCCTGAVVCVGDVVSLWWGRLTVQDDCYGTITKVWNDSYRTYSTMT
jgi:hypothetical protein